VVEIGGGRTREAERGSGERMNGLAATRRARCGWNYDRISRTVHSDRIRTYVLEVRYEKKEREVRVFSFPVGAY